MAKGHVPGTPKTGGRLKGTPNKTTTNFVEKLDDLNIDLIAEIFKLIHDESPECASKSSKLTALINMLSFIFPTRKALALTPEDEALLNLLREMTKLGKNELERVIDTARHTASRASSGAEVKVPEHISV
jgi:hypothetical protein